MAAMMVTVFGMVYLTQQFGLHLLGHPYGHSLSKYGITYDIFPVNGEYVTDYVSQRGGADSAVFNLTPGDHTISFVVREDGVRLDSFTLEPITVQAANVVEPTAVELQENLAAEARIPKLEQSIFIPLITR